MDNCFSIQSFGEFIKIIKYYDKNIYKSDEAWHKAYNKFLKDSEYYQKRLLERFITIKEACGNLSMSLILSSIISALIIFSNNIKILCEIIKNPIFWILFILFIIINILLIRMHFEHVERQTRYVKVVIKG